MYIYFDTFANKFIIREILKYRMFGKNNMKNVIYE